MAKNWKLTAKYNTKRNEGCMQRTTKQKQPKQPEQSDSWPSHKPQRRNLFHQIFKIKTTHNYEYWGTFSLQRAPRHPETGVEEPND